MSADQWIPVSERLPVENYSEYIATAIQLPFNELCVICVGYEKNGQWSLPDTYIVLAWQPLPDALGAVSTR